MKLAKHNQARQLQPRPNCRQSRRGCRKKRLRDRPGISVTTSTGRPDPSNRWRITASMLRCVAWGRCVKQLRSCLALIPGRALTGQQQREKRYWVAGVRGMPAGVWYEVAGHRGGASEFRQQVSDQESTQVGARTVVEGRLPVHLYHWTVRRRLQRDESAHCRGGEREKEPVRTGATTSGHGDRNRPEQKRSQQSGGFYNTLAAAAIWLVLDHRRGKVHVSNQLRPQTHRARYFGTPSASVLCNEYHSRACSAGSLSAHPLSRPPGLSTRASKAPPAAGLLFFTRKVTVFPLHEGRRQPCRQRCHEPA